MTATDTYLGLLRSVLTDRDNDLPRLVIADWWEENGEPERAEFVRVQCELAQYQECDCGDECPAGRLRRRSLYLQSLHARRWAGVPVSSAVGFAFTRGFVSRITCTAADWLAHADALFWHPGQTVDCGVCRGTADVSYSVGLTARQYRRALQAGRCPGCENAGRVPRECPPTAQPVERVTLTAAPGETPGWPAMSVLDIADDGSFTCDRWPGITFTLP